MARLVRLFVDNGVRKVRLTGGEPLTRGGVAGLAAAIAAMPGLRDLSLSTNGTRLARHALAAPGRRAAPECQPGHAGRRRLPGHHRARLPGRRAGRLRAAREAGFAPVKLNSVVHAATPEDEVERLLAYAREQGFVLRLIEPMPMGDCGRAHEHVDLNALGARLAARHGLVPARRPAAPAPRYWTADGRTHVLGVITPMSRHFCAACNACWRGRHALPVPGPGRPGAAGPHAARASDAELRGALLAASPPSPSGTTSTPGPRRVLRFMAQTGG